MLKFPLVTQLQIMNMKNEKYFMFYATVMLLCDWMAFVSCAETAVTESC